MQPWPSRPYPNDDVFDARVPFNAKPFYIVSLFRCFGYETNDFEQFTMDGCVVCIIFCLLLACFEGDPRAKWLSHIRRNRQSLVCCRCNFSPSRNVEKREWIANFYGYMEIFQHGDDWIVCWAACCFEEKRKYLVRYTRTIVHNYTICAPVTSGIWIMSIFLSTSRAQSISLVYVFLSFLKAKR